MASNFLNFLNLDKISITFGNSFSKSVKNINSKIVLPFLEEALFVDAL